MQWVPNAAKGGRRALGIILCGVAIHSVSFFYISLSLSLSAGTARSMLVAISFTRHGMQQAHCSVMTQRSRKQLRPMPRLQRRGNCWSAT